MPLCLLDELVEVHRIVDLGEIVVEEVRRVALQDVLELDLELGTGFVVHRFRPSATSRANACASAIRVAGSAR